MELQEFITETLTQIVNGVVEAQNNLKDTGSVINPKVDTERYTTDKGQRHGLKTVQKIKMNVVLSVTEKEGSKKGIGVARVINAGINSETIDENRKVTSVEFEIPVVFPVMNGNEE